TLPYRKHHKDASVHSKPTTTTCSNNNKIPSNAIKDNFIFDVLDPNDRQKYQQDYVNRPTTLYSVFNNTTNNDTKSKQLKKLHTTNIIINLHLSRQIPLPDSIFKALDTDENSENKCNSKSHVFKSPTTTTSIKRDSLVKWSVRHRPDNTISSNNNDIPSTEPKQLICKKNLDANQNMKQSTELKNSDSSMNLETPTTTTSKNGSSSAYSRPGRFFRSLTLRIARSFRCGRFKSG
ncbi:serine/threonine kinase, partial [Schistosoma japonicum]